MSEWDLFHKTVAITDLSKKHVPCLAHTLNLGVQDGLVGVEPLLTKPKEVVAHFKRSTSSMNVLSKTQEQRGGGDSKGEAIDAFDAF